MADDDGFLSRWSRRKAQLRDAPAESLPERPAAVAEPPAVAEPQVSPQPPAPAVPPPPTLDDVAQIAADAPDFSRFVARGVDPGVKNAALKKLFTDPHFNVMDGLDTYIDDYGKPDPLPAAMLRQLVQGRFLGMFDDADEKAAAAAQNPQPIAASIADPAPTLPAFEPPPHEDPDLRLQPLDATGRTGDPAGTGEEPCRAD